jgi:hypothetical protein
MDCDRVLPAVLMKLIVFGEGRKERNEKKKTVHNNALALQPHSV